MKKYVAIITFAGAALTTAPAIHAQQFKGMGDPPPGPFCTGFIIRTLGNDGTVYGGLCGFAGMWNKVGGFEVVPSFQPSNVGEIDSVNSMGALFGRAELGGVIVPAVWNNLRLPPVPLSGYPAGWNCVHVMSNSTSAVIVGHVEPANGPPYPNHPFIWTAPDTFKIFDPVPAGLPNAGLLDVSDDGKRAVGGAYLGNSIIGLVWDAPTLWRVLVDLPGGESLCGLHSVSADGGLASGYTTPGDAQASVWTDYLGLVPLGTILPQHKGSVFSGSSSASDDSGFVAVGTSELRGIEFGRTAMIWNALDGMRSVEDMLVNDYGLTEAAAWQLTDTEAISPNGRYIAGLGVNPQGNFETWWAEIIPFCYADCDRDKQLTFFDFLCYINHFDAEDIYSNCNNDGAVDFFDFLCFINKWHGGCP